MSTALQCENRLASSYAFNDENLSRTPSPISSCSFYVDTSLDNVVPCDLPDPVWNKMSVASSGVKKRKKPDSKPQSQINKCLNEKRRREQENIFIEELAELISVTFSDMNSLSVKPDKCAILQETVHQIRNIKQQQQQQLELQQQHNQQNQQGVVSTDDIQQGEVSSSKPTVLSNEIFGPLLLEALEGFAFLLNHEGKVEYVTDNVSQFIKYSKDEILGRSIYSIIHQGDHARFSSCLLPSVGNWSQSGSGGGANQLPKNRPFNCRLLVKPSDDSEESVSENTEPTNKYEHVQISSTLLKGEGTYVPFQISSTLIKGDGASSGGNNEVSSECGEMGPGVICVARRIPANEKQLTLPGEQFTTRLDTSGKILAVDTSGVSATYSLYLNKELVGKLLQELCYVGDLPKLNNHLKETLIRESHLSTVYKIMVSPDKYVQIRTKSRLYKGGSTNEGDFIMATHSIVGESDEVCQMIESTTLSNTHHSSTSGSHGGGPMVNAMNGRLSAVSTPDNSNTMTLSGGGGSSGNNNQSTEYSTMSDLSVHDFEFFPTSNYDMEDRTPWPDRPESRHSLTSAPSPLNPFSHVSPAPNPPSTPFSAGLPFSPLDSEKDGKEMMMADVAGMSENCESARLRNLLTNKKSDADDVNANRKQILENLLNNDGGMEIDGGAGDAGPSPGQRMPMTPSSMSGSDSSSYNKSGQNLMLLKLLNKKGPENDDSENKHEYLQKLLKPEDKHELSAEEAHQQPPHQQSSQSIHHIQAEDTILKGIGFMSSPTSPTETANRLRKRPSEEIDEIGIPTKKITILDSIPPPPPIPVANSKLQEKNKMLMSLLAKQPTTPATIPHLPPSVISATPQDRLPKILTSATPPVRPSTIWSNSGNAQQQQQIRVPHQQQRANANMAPRGGFLNELLQPQQQQQQQQQHQQQLQQQQHIQQQLQNQIKLTTNNNNILPWEPLAPAYNNDDDLSKLLDQLFENVPDAVITEPTIMSLISSMEQGEGLISNTDNSMGVNNVTLNNAADSSANVEKMAIHAIKNSFMSYEQQSAISNRMQLNQTLMQQQQQQLQQQQQRQQQPQPPQQAINPSAQQQFPPPPMYQQRPNRLQIHQNSGQLANRPMTPQYAVTTSTGPYSLQQQEQYRKQYLQQHQKRLLAQQQLQQIIPSNAAANSQVSTSLQSMDSLLNNSAPPNVSLQRSTSLTSEASNTQQLSPGGNNPIYNNAMMNSSQISPPQRQPPSSLSSPYSPLSTNHQQQQSFSSLNFTGANNQPSPSQAQGARSSPSGLSPFQAQLSPRVSQPQTTFTGSSVMSSGAQAQVQQQQNAWSAQTPQQQMVNNRLSLQQQQNPMLDARLSNAGYAANNRATLFAQQPQKSQQAQSPQLSQVRGLTSPSPRQSPFPADISPTTATSYVSAAAASQQQYRLQRAMSMPGNANMPTSQVPSGNNCIRAYPSNMGASLNHKDSSQTPSHPPPLYSPVMYPHHGESSPYCYPEQSLPMYGDRSRVTHSSGNNNVNNNNAVGDYVRQELRAVVGARQQGMRAPSVDLESLGLSFEMPSADNDGSKWGSLSADVNEGSSSAGLSARTSLDDVMRAGIGTNPNNMNQMSNVGGGGEKSSLLQKLLSE